MSRLTALLYDLKNRNRTGLDIVLSPQVRKDELQLVLERLARLPSVRTILEIGASSGDGSTAGLVRGMKKNPSSPQLHSFEFSCRRFERLQKRYRSHPDVHCHNMATVAASETMTADDIRVFFSKVGGALYGQAEVAEREFLQQLDESHAYIRDHHLQEGGIAAVKSKYGIEIFDLVFIDGGPFTGEAELKHSYGAKFLAFDDIFDLKNYNNHQRMLIDPNYELVAFSKLLRGGYSVFRRKGD